MRIRDFKNKNGGIIKILKDDKWILIWVRIYSLGKSERTQNERIRNIIMMQSKRMRGRISSLWS